MASTSQRSSQHRGGKSDASPRVLTDHDEIRRCAEERGGKPARVKATGDDGTPGIIQIDFPGYTGEDTLESISWDEWFKAFDEKGLALVVQDRTADGRISHFNEIVKRQAVGSFRSRSGVRPFSRQFVTRSTVVGPRCTQGRCP